MLIEIISLRITNQHLGWLSGDSLVQYVSSMISTQARSTDHICRIKGDLFCLILPDTVPDNADVLALRIKDNLENTPFLTHGKRITISLNVVTQEYLPGDTPVSLINRTKSALKKMKHHYA
ncbi:hypothetical protein A3715_18145 [Oleiphilus sp. HI0009]|nr:hypothetical protein A3715_18145 [Oleiphilus sp. HI0009]